MTLLSLKCRINQIQKPEDVYPNWYENRQCYKATYEKKGSFKEREAQEPNTSFLRRYAEGSTEERHIKPCTYGTVLDPELIKKQKAACTIQVRV